MQNAVRGRAVLMLPTWYPGPGDPVAGVFVRDQALAIAAHNDVTVLVLEATTPSRGRSEVTVADDHGLRTVRVRAAHGPLRKLWLTLALARGLRVAGRPDLVHGHVFRVGAVAAVLGRLMRVPVVVSEHHSLFPRRLATRTDLLLARIAFRGAHVVAPVSESLREAIEAYGIHARFRVVPNPVDTELFHPGPRAPGDEPVLLYVGRMAPVKGVPRLLEAAAELARRGRRFRLVLVGDGPERAHHEALAARLSLPAEFAGSLERAEVAARMRAADLLVLASDWETLSSVLLEAQASGLPAVAPRVGGIPEALPEAAGVLVAPADVAALARGIEEALGRDFDREAIARAVRERFGAEAVAARWDEVYAEAERVA
ncbi:MAG: glycosyltransferase [Thermoleophilaceae bacterium]|nr:glycosyltransferase [Thermoleophilaceae bacterium]